LAIEAPLNLKRIAKKIAERIKEIIEEKSKSITLSDVLNVVKNANIKDFLNEEKMKNISQNLFDAIINDNEELKEKGLFKYILGLISKD